MRAHWPSLSFHSSHTLAFTVSLAYLRSLFPCSQTIPNCNTCDLATPNPAACIGCEAGWTWNTTTLVVSPAQPSPAHVALKSSGREASRRRPPPPCCHPCPALAEPAPPAALSACRSATRTRRLGASSLLRTACPATLKTAASAAAAPPASPSWRRPTAPPRSACPTAPASPSRSVRPAWQPTPTSATAAAKGLCSRAAW